MAYYAPFQRPIYYNPSITQDMQNAQQFQQQFQPYQQQQMPQQQMQMQAPQIPMQANNANNDMIWVQGEAGAKAYLVAPNNTVTLWDSENPTIYVKSADGSGMPSMRILDFVERDNAVSQKTPTQHVCQCGKDFVRVSDFNALEAKFEALTAKFESFTSKPATKTTKTQKTEEE